MTYVPLEKFQVPLIIKAMACVAFLAIFTSLLILLWAGPECASSVTHILMAVLMIVIKDLRRSILNHILSYHSSEKQL